ncbi:MAG: hypothetical protein VX201_12165, partial [Pseudomonadota bacterium]|nr:hypothetical protein [Pseudomonadota bacterium]
VSNVGINLPFTWAPTFTGQVTVPSNGPNFLQQRGEDSINFNLWLEKLDHVQPIVYAPKF